MAQTSPAKQPPIPAPDEITVALIINGVNTPLKVAPWTTLLDALRDHLDLTGTKKGFGYAASSFRTPISS